MTSALDRAEMMYQGRHQRKTSTISDPEQQQLDSDTTDDLSKDRDSIRRMEWIFNRILEIVPQEHRGDARYTIMRTMLKEGLKDLALVPDRVLIPMLGELAQALKFAAEGSMEELEAYLAAERDNPEEG